MNVAVGILICVGPWLLLGVVLWMLTRSDKATTLIPRIEESGSRNPATASDPEEHQNQFVGAILLDEEENQSGNDPLTHRSDDSQWRATPPSTNRLLGFLFIIAGVLVPIVGFLLLYLTHGRSWLINFVCFSFCPFAFYLVIRGKKHLQPKAKNVLATGEPFILLLRCFEEDDLEFGQRGWSINPARFFDYNNRYYFEKTLVDALSDYFPVIAIGDPKEPLPSLGAPKMYCSDDWKQAVQSLIQECVLVLMIVGTMKKNEQELSGLLWEFGECVRQNIAKKLLLVFPPLTQEELQELWETWCMFSEEMCEIRLPFYLPPSPLVAFFSGDWNCQIFSGSGQSSPSEYTKALKTVLRHHLLW